MVTQVFIAIRALRRRWASALSEVVILVLGLTMSACLFAVVDGVLLKPLPFQNPNALFVSGPTGPIRPGVPAPVTWDDVGTLKRVTGVEGAAGFVTEAFFEQRYAEDEALRAAAVTDGFFDVLGIVPQLGRPLLPSDAVTGSPMPVVIGDGLWRRRFGAEMSVVGRRVRLGGRQVAVVGVMPSGLDFPEGANVWVPALAPRSPSLFHYLRAIVRIRGEAPASLGVGGSRFVVTPLKEFFTPPDSRAVTLLYFGTGVVVFIAWIHLGTIRLTEAERRRRDIAVRSALGASAASLARAWLLEAGIVAAAAMVLSSVTLPGALHALVSWLPAHLTQGQPIGIDWRTLAYLTSLTLSAIVALTTGPLMFCRRVRLADALHGRSLDLFHVGYHRMRLGLLGLQVVLTAALLYLAATSAHHFLSLRRVPIGFDAAHVMSVQIPGPFLPTRQQAVMTGLRQLPIVVAVAEGEIPLLGGKTPEAVWSRAPQRQEDLQDRNGDSVWAVPGYLQALGVPLTEGRDADPAGRIDAVLLSQSLVRSLQLKAPVTGQTVYVGGLPKKVSGVVADIRGDGPAEPASPFVYEIRPPAWNSIVVRTSVPSRQVAASIVQTAGRLAGTTGPLRFSLAADLVDRATAAFRARTALLLILALASFTLGIVGVVGTTFETVQRRLKDIAIQMALGQSPTKIVLQLSSQAGMLAVAGVGVGVWLGAAAARFAPVIMGIPRSPDAAAVATVGLLVVGSATAAAVVAVLRGVRTALSPALRAD